MSALASAPAVPSIVPEPPRTLEKLAIATVFGGLAALLIAQLHLDWSLNPSYSYGWVVPFLAVFTFWNRWQQQPPAERVSWRAAAVALLVMGAAILLPLRIVAKANPDWRLVSWLLAFSLCGIALCVLYLVGGARWARYFAFPVLFCLVAVPWPTQLEQSIVQGLMQVVAAFSVEFLNLAGIVALRQGNVIQLVNGVLGVEDACSGIRSLQSTFMISLFFGEFYRMTWQRRLLIIVLGALVAFVTNVLRTFFLAWVAANQGMHAVDQWHDTAGWTVMVSCLAAVWALSVWLSPPVAPGAPRTSMLGSAVPLRLLIALAVWLAVVEFGSEAWYRAREHQVTVAPAWAIDWTAATQAEEVPIPRQAVELLNYNEGRGIAYNDESGKQWNLFFFKWLPGRTAALAIKIHRPEICLPATGFQSVGEIRSQLLQVNGVTLPTRAYRFQDGVLPLHVYYSYWDGAVFRDTEEMIQEDWTMRGRLSRVWKGRRDRGARTLEMAVWGHEDDASADAAFQAQLAAFVHRES